jgi:4-amino-4-deoxy-L-arabinose transferase-like glycosyltransferase
LKGWFVPGPRRAFWLALLIVLLGSGLRMIALEQSPPGLAPDEASNAYDAYSIWRTGRDQHGVFLPTVMQAMNDYRMPLFIYSQAPIVGMGGLSVMNARLTSAFLSILGIAATYWLGTLLFNRLAGLAAAFFLAVSPWHIQFGRTAYEGSITVFAVVLTMGLFWRWQQRPRYGWLIGAAVASGLGLYTYSVMKLFLALMVVTMGLIFWHKVVLHWRQVVVAALIGGVLAVPMLYDMLRYPDEMQARYQEIAVFRPQRPLLEAAQEALRNAWYNVSPDFLFGRGDIDNLQHPPGLGQLYPVQAVLLPIGVGLGLKERRYRLPLAVAALWILAGVLPAALTKPNLPGSGHSLRALPAVVPWQLLSGLGLAGLLNLLKPGPARLAAVLVVLGWVGVNASGYFGYYFTRYPADAAYRFDVGMREVVTAMDRVDDDYETVYFTCHASWPYLHILFFTRYDPALLQADLPVRGSELFAPVSRVGKYHITCDTEELWASGQPGLFVVPVGELPDVQPLAVTTGADGQPLFKIIGRR